MLRVRGNKTIDVPGQLISQKKMDIQTETALRIMQENRKHQQHARTLAGSQTKPVRWLFIEEEDCEQEVEQAGWSTRIRFIDRAEM
jgi:hypothetical protein